MKTNDSLEKKNIIELRLMAKELGVKSATTFKKAELIEKIREKQGLSSDSGYELNSENQNEQQFNFRSQSGSQADNFESNIDQNYRNYCNHGNTNNQGNQGNNLGYQNNQGYQANQNNQGNQNNQNNQGNNQNNEQSNETFEVEGFLEILSEGFGFLRGPNYVSTEQDVYVSPTHIKRFNMKTGDMVKGISKSPRYGERFKALIYVKDINGDTLDIAIKRKPFEKLIPIYPNERLHLEREDSNIATRIIDLFCPIGKGQRGLIVAPPKAGKTMLLKNIANSITENHKNIDLIVLLIDERPEEVTDMKESIDGEVIFSTFDQESSHHTKVAEMVLARAQRLVEHGRDVVILLDSITRLARAYNLEITPTGRTLSGGIDPGALYGPKKLFGAARNIRGGGSLTILGTALIETGSRMDDVIYEEFKGTGNMEIHLDRKLAEKRIFPAVDIYKSGTRREDLLLTTSEQEALYALRKQMDGVNPQTITESIINALNMTESNQGFIDLVRTNNASIFEY